MARRAVLLTVVILASCRTVEDPEVDRTPPGMPNAALLRATHPDAAGQVTVSGASGCVEAAVRVEARESGVATPARGTATAAADGSFVVVLSTGSLQLLEVVAEDAAGNASRAVLLVVGAPFSLEGPLEAQATAGEEVQPVVVVVRDEAGEPTADVPVSLVVDGLSPQAGQSDAQGQVSWTFTAPTQAGARSLTVSLEEAFRATPLQGVLQVTAAEASQLVVASGSEQVAAAGAPVPDALVVRVTDAHGNGVAATPVVWQALAGSLTGASATTDSLGQAEASWTLPGSDGESEVVVTSAVLAAQEARFVGVAGPPPSVSSYTPDPAIPGVALTLNGSGFSRDADYNDVMFPGGVPGEVLSATPTSLQVVVPAAVAGGALQVTVCGRGAAPTTLRVEEALGAPIDVIVGAGSTRLETPTGTEEYMLVVTSAPSSSGHYGIGSSPVVKVSATAHPIDTPDAAWHRWLRQQEHRTASLPRIQQAQTASKPLQEADFTVLAHLSGSSYETVTATLRYEGTHTHLYVDNRVLAGELSDADVLRLGSTFDASHGSYDSVRDAFGVESDVDANGAVVILLTPTVNGLTPPGSGAYVGGFFFSQDLHAVANSNGMEILYGLVPDPTGRWGNVFPVAPTLDVLDSVLPHEQQHLVSYANHVLVQGGDPEELWLNEALSHVAEDLCGFPQQNILRADLFLQAPHLVSMTTGGNALQERGMSYLFARYVADHATAGFLRRLIETSSVGTANLTQASGRAFTAWMRDWALTLTLAHEGLAAWPYTYTSLDLVADFRAPQETVLSLEAPSASGTLPVSGMRYYRLSGTTTAATDLEVTGDVEAVVVRVR